MVEADSHLELLPPSILDIYKKIEVWTHRYAVHRHKVAALHSYLPYLAHILGFWITYGVEMMSLCHGWGWQPPQTASCIHIRHMQSVWAHWHAVHRHKVAALHSYPPYLAQILGFWVTYGVDMMSSGHGWGWQPPQTASCIYIDIYKVFENIDILSIGMW